MHQNILSIPGIPLMLDLPVTVEKIGSNGLLSNGLLKSRSWISRNIQFCTKKFLISLNQQVLLMDGEFLFTYYFRSMVRTINARKKNSRYTLYERLQLNANNYLWCDELRKLIKELKVICSRALAEKDEKFFFELAHWIEFLEVRYKIEQKQLHASMHITEQVRAAETTIDKATRAAE